MTRPASPDDVLCIRRHQPTRLEGFVDASFAFVVTMLIISAGHVPSSIPDMLNALRGVPAFALSFLLIARFWKGHRDWSRCYDIEDGRAIVLSLALVFVVLIFAYPLRFIFALLCQWLSNGWLIDQRIELHSIDEYRIAFEVYGIGFAMIAALFALLYRHALRVATDLDPRERIATRMHQQLWWMTGGVALLSALCAAALPLSEAQAWLFGIPGTIYGLNGVLAPAIRRWYGRQLAMLQGTP